MRRIAVVAAGGTGGHLFPAQALAEALIARGWGIVLLIVGGVALVGGAILTLASLKASGDEAASGPPIGTSVAVLSTGAAALVGGGLLVSLRTEVKTSTAKVAGVVANLGLAF